MRRPLQTLLFAALLLAPASLLAQDVLPRPLNPTEHLELTGTGDHVVADWASVYIGPYDGAFTSGDPTIPQITLYCVDYADDVSLGNNWDVNVTNIGGGSPDLSNTQLNSGVVSDGLTRYKQAAFLTSLFSSWSVYQNKVAFEYSYNGSDHKYTDKQAVYSGIHAAIWRIMTEGTGQEFPSAFPGWGMNSTLATAMSSVFYGMANVFRDSGFDLGFLDPGSNFSFSQFSVLTDVGNSINNHPGQEYLVRTTTVTPEPATYVMLLTGLLLVFGVSRVRRKGTEALVA